MQAALATVVATLSAQLGAEYRRLANGQVAGPCPCCQPDGRGRHLYLTTGAREPVVFYCQRGCSYAEIVTAGRLSDLTSRPAKEVPMPPPRRPPAGAPEIHYDYTHPDGSFALQVVRWGRGPGKKIKQRIRDHHGQWQSYLNGYKPPLYHAHLLAQAGPGTLVALTEGEEDAERVTRLGVIGTTSVMGSSGWEAAHTAQLAGFRVAILPDHDEPGVKLARRREADCEAAGLRAALVWLDFPITKDHGRDVSDWLDAGHSGEELRARIEAAFAGQLVDPTVPPPRFRLLSETELLAKPPPTWQVEDLFEAAELAVLWGLSGSGKTFLMTDLALSITQGRTWCGRAVKPGRCLYVNADGGSGFGKRVRAWRSVHGSEGRDNLRVCDEPVNLFDPEAVRCLGEQMGQGWALVVIDTLAECSVGADENSQKDMGIVRDSLRRLGHATGAAVAVQRHATKDGTRSRGILTIENAAATVVQAKKPDRVILARCEKQRNWAPFGPLEFTLRPVGDSCVVLWQGSPSRLALKEGSEAEVLRVLAAAPGLTAAQLITWTGIAQSTLYRHVQSLLEGGLVAMRGERGPGGKLCYPTPDGLAFLTEAAGDSG